MKPRYFDYAATTPLDPQVLEVMLPYFSEQFYNPSAQYEVARKVKTALNDARGVIAHCIGSRPSELIFTAGGTEANNLAIKGVHEAYPNAEIVVSAVEHDSVLEPARACGARIVSVTKDGSVDLTDLTEAITDKTVLVSIQYVNNEIGTIQPLKEIAQLIDTIKRARQAVGNALPLYFHTDACQAANYLDIHVSRLGLDLMTLNASKIYGPKQIGVLFVKSDVKLVPQILGGGQERGQRSGTENVPAIIGFAKALKMVQDRRHDEARRVGELQHQLMQSLEDRLPQTDVTGSRKHRIVNNIHITVPGYDNETLMMQLDLGGIICAVGSACSASSEEPSHVLTALGMPHAQAQSSLRFTIGHGTTTEDITVLVDELCRLIG